MLNFTNNCTISPKVITSTLYKGHSLIIFVRTLNLIWKSSDLRVNKSLALDSKKVAGNLLKGVHFFGGVIQSTSDAKYVVHTCLPPLPPSSPFIRDLKQRGQQKSGRVRLAKQQPLLHNYNVKLSNFTFCRGCEHKATILFFFS